MKIPKEKYDLFGRILAKVMVKLGYIGEIVGYQNEGNRVIFQFKLTGNLGMLYPLVEKDSDDICEMMNSANIGLRKWKGNLEMRFPDTVVFMANAILCFNPELEFYEKRK
jgi:hypothetical protein